MRIWKVEKELVSFGKNEWRIATIVKVWEWVTNWAPKVLEKVIALWNKLVCFEWDFTSNPDVYTVVSWLCNSWYEVIYNTDAGDEIWNMVRLRNIILSIKVNIPKPDKQVSFIPWVLNYMQEKDELRFEIQNKQDWLDFRAFEKTMNIIKPAIILEVNKEFDILSIIKDELIWLDRIIIKYEK